jgi:hypothetical protein
MGLGMGLSSGKYAGKPQEVKRNSAMSVKKERLVLQQPSLMLVKEGLRLLRYNDH